MSFYEQLILTLADKFAVGLIVLILGFWINKKLEKFRTELNKNSKEHEIKFGILHEKRSEVIHELYFLLSQIRSNLGAYEIAKDENHPDEMLERLAKKANESGVLAYELLRKNRLYLSKKMADSIDEVLDSMRITSEFYQFEKLKSDAFDKWKLKSKRIVIILSLLENEFRLLFGSEDPSIKK